KDGGTAGGGEFGGGDGTCSANDEVGPGKAFRHVRKKRDDLRVEFAPRVRSAHRIIVAFAGLVHDAQVGFSRGEEIHCVHDGAINGKGALAAAGNKDTKGFLRFARGDGEKFG